MNKRLLPLFSLVLLLGLTLIACQISIPGPDLATPTPAEITPTTAAALTVAPPPTAVPTLAPRLTPTGLAPTPVLVQAGGAQPYRLEGEFTFTNDFVLRTYFVEHAVALVDLHGFITRDLNWEIPVNSQVLGFLQVDKDKNHGTFQLDLPERPEGTYNDVSHSPQPQTGVQVYTLAYWGNLTGGPYAEGDDRSTGWPGYLTSVVVASSNKDEITGGKLVVWAPDDKQLFPTGFGPDGLLFTPDDPTGPLPAGYSVIDLNQKPFAISRQPVEKLTLNEPIDFTLKDYSQLSYSTAFDQMVAFLRKEYAFNGIPGKDPGLDAAYAAVSPKVKAAESLHSPTAYYKALLEFTNYFKDGHTSVDGGNTGQTVIAQLISSGYGLAIRELDDGSTIVVYVTQNGPADKAGIKLGAILTDFNGTPIKDAISQVSLLGPESTDVARRYEQARLLFRAPRGTQASIGYANPGQSPKTASLTAVQERNSYYATTRFQNYDPSALPVEYQILPSGAGYVKINSNNDDLNLIVRLFERALQTFTDNNVTGLIIDMRENLGGQPLGLAGFLTKKEITMGLHEYYNETTGKFEPEGLPDKVTPNTNQYTFKKMVLMVDMSCYSACEIESYGFSKVPGMVVVGMYPTAGTEADVARGQFKLPGGMSLQFPTGRFVLPDGSIFLEGTGVQPTVRVPITAANVLSTDDVVLKAAEAQLNK